jgi:MFS family permease
VEAAFSSIRVVRRVPGIGTIHGCCASNHARATWPGVACLLLFAAGAAPIPLYGTYRIENGVTTDQLALAAVIYFAGAILTLLMLARLSDHLGRKPVALTALGVAA